jgi:Zn-dependent protease with chaperone function
MSVSFLDHRYPTLQEYIEGQERSALRDADGTPRYAHPMDEWIVRSLNSVSVAHVLDKSIDALISARLGQFLATSIHVDNKSFPDLFVQLSHCSETLGIGIPHAVVGDWPDLFNAFTAGTDDYSFIFISSGLSQFFSADEASFVIGHECGHIASRHLIYHTLVWILTNTAAGYLGRIGRILRNTIGFPLLAWERRSEITCDRAGLLCCGDMRVAERALIRLVAGFADADRVDIEDYLRKSKEMQEYHGASAWQQHFMTHPIIPKRIEALRLFARSELYHDLSGKPRPLGEELLSREELNRQTNQIVKP